MSERIVGRFRSNLSAERTDFSRDGSHVESVGPVRSPQEKELDDRLRAIPSLLDEIIDVLHENDVSPLSIVRYRGNMDNHPRSSSKHYTTDLLAKGWAAKLVDDRGAPICSLLLSTDGEHFLTTSTPIQRIVAPRTSLFGNRKGVFGQSTASTSWSHARLRTQPGDEVLAISSLFQVDFRRIPENHLAAGRESNSVFFSFSDDALGVLQWREQHDFASRRCWQKGIEKPLAESVADLIYASNCKKPH